MSDEVLNALDAVPAAETPTKQKKVPALGTPEFLLYKRETTRKSRKKSKEKQDADSPLFSSLMEPTKQEAKKILEGRGLKNGHVIDTVYRLLLQAAEQNNVLPNRFLFANGIKKMLKSHEQKSAQLLPEIPPDEVIGELSNRAELYGLYDAGIGSREPTTFEEFLEIRQHCKRDAFYLGKEILGKDFAECHRVWTDYFPKFDPTGLRPSYTQKQAIKWLNDASETKNFLLLASRSAFKSSWSHIWVLSLILCFPDVRVLLVSETRPLSKDFIGVIRSYFEAISGQETRFQQFFPEFTIPMGDGSSLSLDCPMAHLRLAQSIESTSMDSTVAGRRFDAAIFDDPISNMSCGNDVQIQASYNKFLALLKLRETSALALVLGTPWADTDMYARLIAQADENADSSWVYRIDPAFVVKRTARHKLTPALLSTLVEDDIESFLFPERLNFKFLRQEILSSPSFFMSQNLIIFPKDKDSDLKVTFDEIDLRAHLRPIGAFENKFSTSVMSLDRAYSVSKYADYSAIVAGRIQIKDRQHICAVVDVLIDRLRESELVDACVKMIVKHQPTHFVLERDKGWETLIQSIQRKLMLMDAPLPQFIAKLIPSGGLNIRAKAKRIKILELPLMENKLWFAGGIWTDGVFLQFTTYDGITASNSTRKEDSVDAIALLYESFMPKTLGDATASVAEQERLDREAEMAAQQEKSSRHQESIFGSDMPRIQPPMSDDPPAERPADPRRAMLDRVFGNNGMHS
jgi:hypothetical protein